MYYTEALKREPPWQIPIIPNGSLRMAYTWLAIKDVQSRKIIKYKGATSRPHKQTLVLTEWN